MDIVRSTHLGMENDSGECVACYATTTKCHKLGLNNRNLFCYNSGVLGKDLTGPEASFHLPLVTFSLYSYICRVLCVRSSPYKKTQIRLDQDLSSKLHLIADIFLLKALSSNTIMFILKPGSNTTLPLTRRLGYWGPVVGVLIIVLDQVLISEEDFLENKL